MFQSSLSTYEATDPKPPATLHIGLWPTIFYLYDIYYYPALPCCGDAGSWTKILTEDMCLVNLAGNNPSWLDLNVLLRVRNSHIQFRQ